MNQKLPKENKERPILLGNNSVINRREFFHYTSFWGTFLAIGVLVFGILKPLLPRRSVDTSDLYDIGPISDFPVGTTRLIREKKLLLQHDQEGIYAISLICTHLGCTVRQKKDAGLVCPCHGGTFDARGYVLDGPAPKPLHWLKVILQENSHLAVHTKKRVPTGKKLVPLTNPK